MNLKQANILIVDDDKDVLTAFRLLLKQEAGNVIIENNPENLKQVLTTNKLDLVFLDMNFKSRVNNGNEGLYWLSQIKELNPDMLVIMITAYADINLAIKSLKNGATDFIIKPWRNELLLETIRNVLKDEKSTKQKGDGCEVSIQREIIGESSVMQELFRKLEKVAPTDANVLILGESGTGKDLIAQTIHRSSLRKKASLIKVDIGALTETLFESELFGHKKGAFTDAREDRQGLIEAANGGTLFLDEIGNINLQQQAKLLTVLQNRQVVRLGSNKSSPVDIRLLAATNVPFCELADERRFRKDLMYRINTVEIAVPPLRERGNDILLLAGHFLDFYAKKYMKQAFSLSATAQNKLMTYSFPGNVRELQYIMERAIIMADGDVLTPDDLVFSPIEQETRISSITTTTHNLEEMERTAIEEVISKHNGNISRAAKELGLTRGALYRRLSKYDL